MDTYYDFSSEIGKKNSSHKVGEAVLIAGLALNTIASVYTAIICHKHTRRIFIKGHHQFNDIPCKYETICFKTRGEAEAVLHEMKQLITQYGQVSVDEMYRLSNLSNCNYTYVDFGWVDLSFAKVVLKSGMFVIDLPKAILLTIPRK